MMNKTVASIYPSPFDNQIRHELNASIFSNGKIFSYEEAKITSVKNDGTPLFPERTLFLGFKQLNISEKDSIFEKFQADLEYELKNFDPQENGSNSNPTPTIASTNKNPNEGGNRKGNSPETSEALDENKINQESDKYIIFLFNIWINLYKYYKSLKI